MDKVVIKNRERTIAELTQKVTDLEDGMSTESNSTKGDSETPGGPQSMVNSAEIAGLTG